MESSYEHKLGGYIG